MGFVDKLYHAWNAFRGIDPPNNYKTINYTDLGPSTYVRPDRVVLKRYNEKSIIASIYNRIANECASIPIKHVQLDKEGRYEYTLGTSLNECLTLDANIDQTGKMLIRDAVLTMLDEGVAAIVPVVTSDNPDETGSYDVYELRVGKITKWFPKHVEVDLYNQNTGNHVTVTVSKKMVAIIENPLYAIMNDPSSALQRLGHKLALLDAIDEQQGSGKIDLIVQLPYAIKGEQRRAEALRRKTEIETQLRDSKYGIAYTDGTEHITQLNRPVENNVLKSVEYLTSMLYSQLSITDEVLKGTADEKLMLNFRQNVIRPIEDAISEEMKRKFLTKNARTRGQSIEYFVNPFSLVPVQNIADIADKFTRNAILSSNELRQIIGFKPVNDPKADELSNKNLNEQEGQHFPNTNPYNNSDVIDAPFKKSENPKIDANTSISELIDAEQR